MKGAQRDDVVAALRAEDVAAHFQITGQWRGRWMRSRRCGQMDHPGDAFALSRDGKWKCHACDNGGDLLKLIALGENLKLPDDFPRVLEIAAGIAGVDVAPEADLFGAGPVRPAPKERAELVPLAPLPERIALAKHRAAWTWDRLNEGSMPEAYLRSRGLDPAAVLRREMLRMTPVRGLKELVDDSHIGNNADLRTLWYTMGTRNGTLSMVVPVRAVRDGAMVDLRARRVEPLPDQPKIIGMVGGVTVGAAEHGKTRQLVGCYGAPHSIESDHVVIVEGAMDYLTALALWPNAQILGAVEAGSLALVTAHAATMLAGSGPNTRITIVEQADPPRTLKDGRIVSGAADASVNEDPNAATKVAMRILGVKRVGWLFCSLSERLVDGKPVKDLNDLVRAGVDVNAMLTTYTDLASEET